MQSCHQRTPSGATEKGESVSEKEKELAQLLRFWVYPQTPERSDKWISNRSIFDSLLKWHEKYAAQAEPPK
jgi:hypothetical protein